MKPVLHSKIIGVGSPLVILHGFLGMSDNWKTLGNQYAESGFQVHLIDQRNHGKSFHDSAFNYDILANDLKTYIEHHQLDPIILIGHSMGGKTAMQFACEFNALTKKMIVADIAPKFYPPHHQEIINGLLAINLNTLSSRGAADSELSKYISNPGIRQFLLKNLYWKEKGQLAFRFNLPVLSTKMEEIGENITNGATYDGPTLFLKGDKSEYVIADDMLEIQRHFPNASLATIDNAGHWLHAENPKQFFEKSIAFINS